MAGRRGRGRNNGSLIDVLLASPWQLSVGMGVAVFVGLKWIFPLLVWGNPFLRVIGAAFSSVAWLFGGFFVLMGALVFIKDRAGKGRAAGAETFIRARKAEPSDKQPLSWAKFAGGPQPDPDVRRGFLGEPLEGEVIHAESEIPSDAAPPNVWSLALIRELEWKRFEDVCQQFYEKKGIRSETTPLGPDGGIDIRLFQDDSGRPTAIVQCKAWGERLVGVKPVRELLGVMTHEKIGKAFFMTSGGYTDEAKAIAQANRITLIDGAMLLMMIQRLPAEARDSLLAFATEGDFRTPTCPHCGVKMRAVEGKAGRPSFWGCRNYPRCRQVLGMRQH